MSEKPPTLAEVAARYLASLPPVARQEGQQELYKFVRWCGSSRCISQLTPHEVGTYAEGGAGPNPQKRLEPVKGFLAYARKQGLTSVNLALSLKARKARAEPSALVKGPPQENLTLTPEGYRDLKEEIAALKEERPRVTEDIRLAMADKDFRENAPLDAAKEHQGHLEGRIRGLEATLHRATILGEKKPQGSKVVIGSRVVLVDLHSGQKLYYTLVSPREASPSKGKLSVTSPVGKALLNRIPGEIIEVTAPGGSLRYRLEGIEA